MKIGVLTSSRADFGIYLPLLKHLRSDPFFELEIIAFGTHLLNEYGYTLNEIEKLGFKKIHKITTDLIEDDPKSIVAYYGNTVINFSHFWDSNIYDVVFCLGDRYEMSAAVQSSIPFGVKLAHIHGGETTLGAIDNIYRHQISIASLIHFTSTEEFSKKVCELLGDDKNVYTVGSPSLDTISDFKPMKKEDFFVKYELEKSPFLLVTFHPETVNVKSNEHFAEEMKKALYRLKDVVNIVVTMPNADTLGSVFREKLNELKNRFPNKITLVENFGKANYFTAMYYAKALLGNTSSGIIEAASFNKYVVNVGKRQQGRLRSDNILQADFSADEIVLKTNEALIKNDYIGENIYYKNGAAISIIKVLKKLNDKL